MTPVQGTPAERHFVKHASAMRSCNVQVLRLGARCLAAAGILAAMGCNDADLGGANEHGLTNAYEDTLNTFPFVVRVLGTAPALPTPGSWCSGTLVARDRVLTAAHCVGGASMAGVWVLSPAIDLNYHHLIADVLTHPSYRDGATQSYDLAVLKLRDVPPRMPEPIELDAEPPIVGQHVWLAGFGRGSIWTPSRHKRLFGDNYIDAVDEASVIRVGNNDDSVGTLPEDGDSGGPLLVPRNGRYVLVGAVSGYRDAASNVVYYANVFAHRNWILGEMCPKCGNGQCAAASAPVGSVIKTPSSPALYYRLQQKHPYVDGPCYHSAQCDAGFTYTCVSEMFAASLPTAAAAICSEGSFFRASAGNGIWRLESGLRRPLAGTWTSSKFSTLYASTWTEAVVPVCSSHVDRYVEGTAILPPCGGPYGGCAGADETCIAGECRPGQCACVDQDGDGFLRSTCNGACATRADCDDTRPSVNPARNEMCGNGLDDDCSADTSDACPMGCSLDVGSLIASGSFANGWACWEEEDHFDHAMSAADVVVYGNAPPSAKITVQVPGQGYEVQLRQRNISVVAGRHYRLTFWARASTARQIVAEMGQSSAPWTNRGLYAPISIGTSGSTYSVSFTATVTDPSAKFGIQVGNSPGQVWFDDVRIEAVAGASCSCQDVDRDGYLPLACNDTNCAAPRTDCDDNRTGVNPGSLETCGNGVDDDCSAGTPDACPVGCTLEMNNIVADGDFSDGLACWEEEDHLGSATIAADTGFYGLSAPSVRIDVGSAGVNYQVQLRRRPVAVVLGRQYRLSFWARASTPRQIIAEIGQDGSPYANRGLWAPFVLQTTGAFYSTDFTATATDPIAKFGFQVGDVVGTVWLDDVRIMPLN